MDDRQEPVTRLGPNSGGRLPGDGDVRVYHWEWGSDNDRRPGLPWIGIFLLVFGGLLLIQQAFPQFEALGRSSSSRSAWRSSSSGRSTAGPARSTPARSSPRSPSPGLLNAAGVEANGLTTFSFGVAFLFIAAVRAGVRRRGRLAALVRRAAGAHRRRVNIAGALVRWLHPADRARRARHAADRCAAAPGRAPLTRAGVGQSAHDGARTQALQRLQRRIAASPEQVVEADVFARKARRRPAGSHGSGT